MAETKQDRLDIANKIIWIVSRYGRHFFAHQGRVSRFSLAENGKLWLVDGYTMKRVYVMYRRGRWKGFTEGGTLRTLIENLADYIVKGDPIRNHFGPWPPTRCGGDLWGYGIPEAEAMRVELRPLVTSIPAEQLYEPNFERTHVTEKGTV